MTSQQEGDLLLAEHWANRAAARLRLAVTRSEQLKDFHEGLVEQGFDALTANELTHSHAKYIDGDYERDFAVLRQCIGRP